MTGPALALLPAAPPLLHSTHQKSLPLAPSHKHQPDPPRNTAPLSRTRQDNLTRAHTPLVGAWKTKRAQEDYQRAMEFVIDKGFSLGMLLYLGIHSMHLSLMLTGVLSYS